MAGVLAYDNTWSKNDIPDDDLAFLKRVLEASDDETLWAMLDFCGHDQSGVYVGGTLIDWIELSSLSWKLFVPHE